MLPFVLFGPADLPTPPSLGDPRSAAAPAATAPGSGDLRSSLVARSGDLATTVGPHGAEERRPSVLSGGEVGRPRHNRGLLWAERLWLPSASCRRGGLGGQGQRALIGNLGKL